MVEREEQAVEEIPDKNVMTRIDAAMIRGTIAPPSQRSASFGFSYIEEEVHVKVDAKEDHKHGNYALKVGGIASEAVVLDTETSGSRGTESGTQGIKHRHLSHKAGE